MTNKIKELMGAAQIRRCVTCGGDKEIKVQSAPTATGLAAQIYTYQQCHACCGVGYQNHQHQPASAQQLAHFSELITRYANEERNKHETYQKRAKEAEEAMGKMKAGERTLRDLLASVYCPPPSLYYDDGELQDNRMHPTIDFLRDDPILIHSKMIQRSRVVFDQNKEKVQEIMDKFNEGRK